MFGLELRRQIERIPGQPIDAHRAKEDERSRAHDEECRRLRNRVAPQDVFQDAPAIDVAIDPVEGVDQDDRQQKKKTNWPVRTSPMGSGAWFKSYSANHLTWAWAGTMPLKMNASAHSQRPGTIALRSSTGRKTAALPKPNRTSEADTVQPSTVLQAIVDSRCHLQNGSKVPAGKRHPTREAMAPPRFANSPSHKVRERSADRRSGAAAPVGGPMT
jgi:hypothetical protein